MSDWTLVYEGFEPQQEGLREALCTLGNGYFCTRGAAPEARADETFYPGTYLAGGYNRQETEIAGRTVENEDLVNMPNWLCLRFRIAGEDWFDLRRVEIDSYRQELDLSRGLLLRTVRFRDGAGRTSELRQRRLVSMADRHLAALETTLEAFDWEGEVEFESALDGRVTNNGVARYRDLAGRHLEPLTAGRCGADGVFLKVQTRQSELRVALAARTRVRVGEETATPRRHCRRDDDYVADGFRVALAPGRPARLEKTVALFTSRDEAISEAGLEARKALGRAPDFESLLAAHARAWEHLWRRYSVELLDGDREAGERSQRILRLHIFHLLQTVSVHTIKLDVGVPSRGWHGEAYRGHVFWDELFIFPLLNLRTPEITRTLLNYRYRRLDEARAAAREAGLAGAMFPWQSGSNGREESQKVHLNPESGNWIPDNSQLQRHVNAAIAWNAWQYFQATGDREFLSFYGAEMILEIARFWAGLASWNEAEQRYEILGVMGPDEYHDAYPGAERPGLDNNAYTNVMAVWVLATALQILEELPPARRRELCETLRLEEEEFALWERISRRMRLVFHENGIISQFEGYGDLAELDWAKYRREHGRVMRLDRILEAEGDTPNRYRCSKQADVLMLFYLFSADELEGLFARLGYRLDPAAIPANIDYYLHRTSHGSTLSQVVHSWVLSRSDRERSWKLFELALRSDIDDIQGGTTPEGIHLGAMAGTVDLVQRGYTGIETRDGVLRLNPCLPEDLRKLDLSIQYRGQSLRLEVTTEALKVSCEQCEAEPVRIRYRDRPERTIGGGETLEFRLEEV